MRILLPINLLRSEEVVKSRLVIVITQSERWGFYLSALPLVYFWNMKTLKLNKYKTNRYGNLRAVTDELAVRVDKIIEYYSFKSSDKEGTVLVTEGGEHHVSESFDTVATKVKKAR